MKGLKKYLITRKNAINLLLEKPPQFFTPSTFHLLRVEIKKIYAFFELLESCSKDFKRDNAFKPFRKIFRQAGKVREIQVEQMLLKKYFTDTQLIGYRKSLLIQRSAERTAFFELINETLAVRLNKSFRDTIPVLATIDKKKVDIYLKKKRNKILKHLIQYELIPDQIHELRKLLKCYYYNKTAIEKGIQNSITQKQTQLTDLLGKWHNSYIIYLHLKKAISMAGINPEEVSQIQKLMETISSEIEIKLIKIKKSVSGIKFSEAP